MRLVIQRVQKASVSVGNKVVGKIGPGLFVLVGVCQDDTKKNAVGLAKKLSKLRIMADEEDKMNLSILDTGSPVLAVSQFTLYADIQKGNRPSFVKAADSKIAQSIYDHFIISLEELGVTVETGEFGSYMLIKSILDGPVTISIDNNEDIK